MVIGTSSHSNAEPKPSPPTAPSPPGSFSLTPGRISIELRWTNSATNGGSAISAYQFQYSRKLTQTLWEPWPDEWTSGGTDNFHLIQGLTPNRRYKVRMRAVNDAGESDPTSSETVDTLP